MRPIKYSDFKTQTRSKTVDHYIRSKELILEVAVQLMRQECFRESVRLLGITLSNLNNEEDIQSFVEHQLELPF